MSNEPQAEYIAALIDLHRGLAHKGPGDPHLTHHILNRLPPLPPSPQIADLGCGSGASALLLAQHYQSPVKAVDISSVFLEELKARAEQRGLDHLILPVAADMAQLPLPMGSLDLIWSEGAAYNLGFETALKTWRSHLTSRGIAVVSELSWFTDDAPKPAQAYWQTAYPTMGSEAENIARANRSGFRVLSTHRLSPQAWWDSYYGPLREQMRQIELTPVIEAVIREMEDEIQGFEQFHTFYGYSFYVLEVA